MQEDRVPKVFISYSWSCQKSVVDLAERLVSQGVDVVLDLWDLKEGQDKYAFMEQSVNNPEITKVLIICDKAYTRKANDRTGGVGDETAIISPELYGNMKQEKFIPVILEKDENGKAYVPAYIKSRIYIDLSDEETYEEEYEKLLRNIYEKPLHRKPVIGKRPKWLDEERNNLSPLSNLIKEISCCSNGKKQSSLVRQFLDNYFSALKSYYIVVGNNYEAFFDKFVSMKELRDVFLDFLPALSGSELSLPDTLCNCFEEMFNECADPMAYRADKNFISESDVEIFRLHIWELFICVIAYLRHIADYNSIHQILTHTYFLRKNYYDDTIVPRCYCYFRYRSKTIEDLYKPTSETPRLFTLVGQELCEKREKRPIYSRETLAETDLFLYQVKNGLNLSKSFENAQYSKWFPTTYVYVEKDLIEWVKMKSRTYCEKYMFTLFGVNTLNELKEAISKCTFDENVSYSGAFDEAKSILNYIKIEEIGSLN